jgi:hypothetical protein
MKQSGKIGAGRHSNAGKWLFDSAGTTDALTGFEHEYSLTCPRKVRRARQPVVARTHNDRIPAACGDLFEWLWKPDYS